MTARQTLILGGTGFLGRRITDAFRRAGDSVAVLSRGRQDADETHGVEIIHADRQDRSALERAFAGRAFDVVVDNIAFSGLDVITILDVLGERVGHYLLTSSSAVYQNRYVARPLRETEADLTFRLPVDAPDPFHPRLGHGYANGKREAEQALRVARVPWTVVRPPVILGPHDRTRRVWWFVQRLRDGGPILIPAWGDGRIFQVAWTDDVASAMVAAAGNPRAFGHAYNIAQAEAYSAETWINAVAAVLGVPARHARCPEKQLGKLGLPAYTLPIAGRPFGHILVNLDAAQSDLGFSPRLEDVWLRDTIAGCAANPPAEDSPGYADRAAEVRVAEELLGRRAAP